MNKKICCHVTKTSDLCAYEVQKQLYRICSFKLPSGSGIDRDLPPMVSLFDLCGREAEQIV